RTYHRALLLGMGRARSETRTRASQSTKFISDLILRRLLHAVDHDYIYWSLGGIQSQSQLFLKCCKDGWTIGPDGRCGLGHSFCGTARRRRIRRPFEVDVVQSVQSRLIDDRATHLLRKRFNERSQFQRTTFHTASAESQLITCNASSTLRKSRSNL